MIPDAQVSGTNAQETIEAPRVRVFRDRLAGARARIAPAEREAPGDRGHRGNALDDRSCSVGNGQRIVCDPESGALQGGADPRHDGHAIAP